MLTAFCQKYVGNQILLHLLLSWNNFWSWHIELVSSWISFKYCLHPKSLMSQYRNEPLLKPHLTRFQRLQELWPIPSVFYLFLQYTIHNPVSPRTAITIGLFKSITLRYKRWSKQGIVTDKSKSTLWLLN